MKTIKFLNQCWKNGDGVEMCLTRLEERYGIKVSPHYIDDMEMFALNYCQINSPKFEEVVKECRSLVLHFNYLRGKWEVVSRAFDRFFNYGEKKLPCKVDKLTFHDKLDGSLVTVFNHCGKWMYRTKSMIMPENEIVGGMGITWKDLIEEALDWNGTDWDEDLREDLSYIFEVVSPYNRVVTRYEEPKAFLLAIRENDGGFYLSEKVVNACSLEYGWSYPKTYTFDSWENCLTGAQELRNLEEGYVGYLRGVPVVKVKNPAYVAAHHLRGEGVLTPKRIVDLILINETDEYLSIFPEDEPQFRPWIEAYNRLVEFTSWDLKMRLAESQNQKDFALGVKDMPNASLLFRMKQGTSFVEAFNSLTRNAKQTMIERYKNLQEK